MLGVHSHVYILPIRIVHGTLTNDRKVKVPMQMFIVIIIANTMFDYHYYTKIDLLKALL